ncbi:membrane protein [Burkholderia lata]|uniref:Membrane protein n=1 Tax=Burkholderia lata (strain ATCC 17760 / DSM 23089 / LMG 22485 / NCIMB 9086 / R18194 / 383) TaxID=482957 RepID=A0A6P2VCD5_BURL3|nr:MFS transporter [Burkholderia lata]VWC76847.1 membrane protein [Burkholderia lata]
MKSAPRRHTADSRYAMMRLVSALLMMTVGSSSMYAVSVLLPAVQSDFGSSRSAASASYMLLMTGFGIGGVLMGRLADRFGVMWPLLLGAVSLGLGYAASAVSNSIFAFALIQGVLVGLLGSGAVFAPLVTDTSQWFIKRRGFAVAICASGNYLAGAVWPPVVQHFTQAVGWRATYMGMAIFCSVVMGALALVFRERPPETEPARERVGTEVSIAAGTRPFGLSLGAAQGLLCVAGTACCVAMAMPQVHIVAYCTDLGYGATRGAEMLSVMLSFGVASRLISGAICDRIGGLRTLLLGSTLQCVALSFFLPFNGLVPLFVVSALFGLFQGGLVPSYAIIVREHFPPQEAGARVGTVLMCTLLGMALGGWMAGKIFDLTGSYHAAFLNGVAWNLLNMGIAVTLLVRARRLSAGCDDAGLRASSRVSNMN